MLAVDTYEYLELNIFDTIIQYFFKSGKIDLAVKTAEIGLKQHPFSLEMKLWLANALMERGDFSSSLNYIEEILLLQPTDHEYLLLKGELLLCTEAYEDAITLYQSLLPLAENRSQVLYQLSEAAQGLNNHHLAVDCLSEALKIDPSNEEIMFELYHSYEQLGLTEKCIEELQSFIDYNPFSKHAWYNQGILFDKLERFEEAISSYEFAVAIDDRFSSAYYNMGVAYMALQEFSKAKEQLLLSRDVDDNEDALLNQSLGHCCFELNELAQAMKAYQKAVAINEAMHESLYGIGLILERKEKWLEASHFFSKAHELMVTNSKYVKALAHTEYQLGNLVAAIDNFEKSVVLDAKDPGIWLAFSYLYHEQGVIDRAIEIILDGLEELPEEAELYYRLCCYLTAKGNLKEAFIYLENALILNFDMHTVLFEFFQDLEVQKAMMRIIDQFRKEN
jgi:tetratricopeptide (TPR) repeat protein